ncbi:uncharacterized protein LOC119674537 [Teleopsis dalmanni]|uniref:uncharacterized protein LOC119674537 n=1 Tax=Teleopsis dalmanni TaxID=139649 RepID=UPI0018CF98FE|nr:uncharacterized protein LOC119674537 [Teleopsis dalmanni]
MQIGAYNFDNLKEIIRHVRHFHNFTNIPVFVGRDVDSIALNSFQEFLNEQISSTQIIFTREAKDNVWNLLRNYVNDELLSIVFCESSTDKIWRIVDRRLRRLRRTKLLVVLKDVSYDKNFMNRMFLRLWDMQFLQVIVFNNATIFNYTPFPQLKISSISLGSEDIFPTLSTNLRGYTVSTPVENDVPRIFCIKDSKGKLHIKGFAYRIFKNFLRRLNATLHITNPQAKRSITTSVNMTHIKYLLSIHQLEITMHPYTGISDNEGIMSYSLYILKNCLIVPVKNEIPRYMYLVRPFHLSTWLLIVLAFGYVAFILTWSSPVLLRDRKLSDRFSRAFLESIAQLAFLSSVYRINLPKLPYLCIYLQLAILGFFITTWYSNLLGSFFTTFLVGKQVDSFEDLIATKSLILAKYYETNLLLEQIPTHLGKKVEPLIVPVNASVQVSHLLNFNTTYSYPFTEERWIFLSLQQQYANKPIYRYSHICFGTPRIAFPMRTDSHFEHPMTQFLMDVQMAGLDRYWLVADFKDALKAGYVRLIDNILPLKALDLNSLRLAWCLVGVGWTVAILTFVLEIYVHRPTYQKSNKVLHISDVNF